MKHKQTILALLLAALCAHSKNIWPADAVYCFDFVSKEGTELVLVKENNSLEIRTPEESWNLPCESGYSLDVGTSTDIIDGIRKSVMPRYYSAIAVSCFDCDSIEIRNLYWVPRTIPLKLLEVSPYLARWPELQKEDALKFKGKIIDAYLTASVKCKPVFDSTYTIKFRAEITGECDINFLNKRKKNR